MDKIGEFKIFEPKNSIFDEIVYRLDSDNYLKLTNRLGYQILGIHSWNLGENGEIRKLSWDILSKSCSSISISNDETEMRVAISERICFFDIQDEIIVKDNVIVKLNKDYIKNTEFYVHSNWARKDSTFPLYFDLISLIICSPYNKNSLVKLDEIPKNEVLEIERNLDFTNFIPDLKFYQDAMEFIDEYAPRLYGGIERHIQAKFINAQNAKIASLENENRILKSTFCSATKRVQNYLSYKLGRAMVENSKSIFGYIKMPFVLWRIKKDHNLTQKINEILSLPKIETLSDYKKAIKYKNHLSYKLGQAMIKAAKTWYKGGFIKLIFEIQKIKKEHKKK